MKEIQYKVNWESLPVVKDEAGIWEYVKAMSYLLKAMKISFDQEVYDTLPDNGKRYFKAILPPKGEQLDKGER